MKHLILVFAMTVLCAFAVSDRLQYDAAALRDVREQVNEASRDMGTLQQQIELLRCNPFYEEGDPLILPPLCNLPSVAQPYGVNEERYGGQGMMIDKHNGIDWAVPDNTPVRASHSGTVFQVWNSATMGYHGYGTYVKIRQRMNDYNGMETVYAHLSHSLVTEGQVVRRGELIGYSGNTGYSTKPHLHFGIRFLLFLPSNDGIDKPYEVENGGNGMLGWVDPAPYL